MELSRDSILTVSCAVVSRYKCCAYYTPDGTHQLTHIAFNRLEPRRVSVIFLLLVGGPSATTLLQLCHVDTVSIGGLCVMALHTYILFLVSMITSLAVYRLSPFHPLAAYPGPVVFKLTRLAAFWVCLGGKQHIFYDQLHKRYGPYVRTGKTTLAFIVRQCSANVSLLSLRTQPHSYFGCSCHRSCPRIPRLH